MAITSSNKIVLGELLRMKKILTFIIATVFLASFLSVCSDPEDQDETKPTASITSPVTNSTVTGSVIITIDATDNVAVTKVDIFLDGSLLITDSEEPWYYNWNTANVADGNQHSLHAKAYDEAGNTSSSSVVLVTVSAENTGPVISGLSANPSSIEPGATSTLTCTASDADGDALTYSWSVTGGAVSGSGSTVTYTAPSSEATYSITCSVSDGNSGQDSETSIITVVAGNTAPVISSLTANPTSIEPGVTSSLTCVASDADGDALTYSWSVTGGSVSGTGSTATYTAPLSEDIYTITCSVSDGKGGQDSETTSITVATGNTAPVISSLTANPESIEPEATSTLTCIAADADGDALTYIWSATGGSTSGTGSIVTYTAPSGEGTYTITCSVSDGNGGQDSETTSITAEVNTIPVIISLTANQTSIDPGASTTLSCIATDEVGDTLIYGWTIETFGGGEIVSFGSEAIYTAPLTSSQLSVTITCHVWDDDSYWANHVSSEMVISIPKYQFSDAHIISNTVDEAYEVFSADLDNDGDQDVIAGSRWEGVSWYPNGGDGNFSSPIAIATPNEVAVLESIYATDLDNDGDLDVLTASAAGGPTGGSQVAWFENNGSGSFSAARVISNNVDWARAVYSTDLDGDGDPDVLSASSRDDKIAWYENDGLGNFGNEVIISNTADEAFDVLTADLDGDGDPDVLSASSADGKIAWYQNDGSGLFGNEQIITLSAVGTKSVYAADIDSDNDIDVITVVNPPIGVSDEVVWYENFGSGDFGSSQLISANHFGMLSVVTGDDLDNDGDIDIIFADNDYNTIAWHPNYNSGDFGFELNIYHGQGRTHGVRSIITADLDNDGDQDVLFASPELHTIGWLENLLH
jgi:hypothetical protein